MGYIVYEHINKINNKIYVGITSKDNPEDRWGQDGVCYHQNRRFYPAIKKYGWDNFEHVILFSGLSHDEACAKEIELISLYNTTNPKYGYNLSTGGDGFSFRHSEETKKILSQKMTGENNPNYGKQMSDKQKEKLREVNIGKHLSNEHKQKISNTMTGKKHHKEEYKQYLSNKLKRKIQRSDGVIYNSRNEAAEFNGVCGTAISNSIKRNKKCAGYYWKYI